MIRALLPEDDLTELVASWQSEWRGDIFGLAIEPAKVIRDLHEIAGGPRSTVLAKIVDGKVVGVMGLVIFQNPYGGEHIVNEHCWYVVPAHRGYVRDFFKAAREWARFKGCSHYILNASHMASGMCDRVSELYEKMGLAPFERSFIGRV